MTAGPPQGIVNSSCKSSTLCLAAVRVTPEIEYLSCINQWLKGDGHPSRGYWSCEDCNLCRVQDIDAVVDWFGAVMWGAIRLSNSPIGGASESSCPAESVD